MKNLYTEAASRRRSAVDSYTSLLLHMDGDDESTTFTDSSPYIHTVTAYGTAQIDTAYSKFSGASGKFYTTNSRIEIPYHSGFVFGSGDFTIDFWAFAHYSVFHRGIYLSDQGGVKPGINIITAANFAVVKFYASTDGVTYNIASSFDTGIELTGLFTHIAVVRHGEDFLFFQNGTLTNSFTSAASIYDSGGSPLVIGGGTAANQMFYGWMDEFRISKGIARWTSNFTPPIAPYSS